MYSLEERIRFSYRHMSRIVEMVSYGDMNATDHLMAMYDEAELLRPSCCPHGDLLRPSSEVPVVVGELLRAICVQVGSAPIHNKS
jgi:hypothetical protein